MNHDEYKEAATLDALGALGERERGALDAHTRDCGECLRERVEMRDVAALLALAAPAVAPPPQLRERLFERVRESGAASRDTKKEDSEVQTLTAGDARETTRTLINEPERFTAPERLRTAGGMPAWARAAAYGALAASVVLALAILLVWRENRALREEVARLGAERSNAGEEAARTRDELARERELAELLSAPQARLASLAGTKDAPGARASVAYDPASGRAFLLASGLPPAPDGKEYQIWYIDGGKPVPGQTFRADDAGHGRLRDQAPPAGRDAKQFAVTLEPEGGVSAPTGAMYLIGALANPTPSDAPAK
jgi:hypothetical protein